jgi:hypothetical protein
LYANHLIWPLIFASYFYLNGDGSLGLINAILRNSFLVLLLLSVQYISIFKTNTKSVFIQLSLSLLFLIDINPNFELLRLFVLMGLWVYLVFYLLTIKHTVTKLKPKTRSIHTSHFISRGIGANLHYQILFRSCISSTFFRLATLLFLIIGFILASHHFAGKSNQDLLPYAIALEALISYYISGFFVNFSDQRKLMHQLLTSLPVKRLFWPVRDLFVVALISLVLHGVLFIWEQYYFSFKSLLFLLVYQLMLLLVCYPIRILIKQKQTYFSFTILFVITTITIFNLS